MAVSAETLVRAGRRLARAPSWLAAGALFAMMLLTFLDVLGRSALNTPIEASTEMTRLLMAVVVFASMPVISGGGRHIAVDLADPLFGPFAARLRDGLINFGCGAMLLWPAWRVWELAERARGYGDVTEYLGIPTFYAGVFISAATCLTALVLVLRGLLAVFAPGVLRAADAGDPLS